MNWNSNVYAGNNCLLTQLNRRMNMIKRIAYMFNEEQLLIIANGIVIGKLNYTTATWGRINRKYTNKINKIIIKTANIITKYKYMGKTDEFLLRTINWNKFEKLYLNSCYKLTYDTINSEDNTMIKYVLTNKRNIRNLSENKLGPHETESGWDHRSQSSFI